MAEEFKKSIFSVLNKVLINGVTWEETTSFIYFILLLPPKCCHVLSTKQQSAAHQNNANWKILKRHPGKHWRKPSVHVGTANFNTFLGFVLQFAVKFILKLAVYLELWLMVFKRFLVFWIFFSAAPPNKGFRINSHHPAPSLMEF